MSKAFTREDDAGLDPPRAPEARARLRTPRTIMGIQALRQQLEDARRDGDAAKVESIETKLAAGVISPPEDLGVAGLGAEVTLRDARGRERVVRIVTPDEVGLVPSGASPTSPLAAAIVGAREGASVELDGPAGEEELVVLKIAWPV